MFAFSPVFDAPLERHAANVPACLCVCVCVCVCARQFGNPGMLEKYAGKIEESKKKKLDEIMAEAVAAGAGPGAGAVAKAAGPPTPMVRGPQPLRRATAIITARRRRMLRACFRLFACVWGEEGEEGGHNHKSPLLQQCYGTACHSSALSPKSPNPAPDLPVQPSCHPWTLDPKP